MLHKYRIYPTLVNTFSLYLHESKNAEGVPYVSFEEMIDRINRVYKPPTEAQQRGVNFEDALLKGEGEELFPSAIIARMRAALPAKYKSQFYVSTTIKNIELYGFVDVVGGNRAIDIKTTARYEPQKFVLNHQNLYLLGLKQWNIRQLDYLITDFEDVYVESYHYTKYDFQPLLDELFQFVDFLEANRSLITDKKIFKA
ncbi:MAG: hypothetical protein U0Y10_03670 [Spirosomataceae bacterium]